MIYENLRRRISKFLFLYDEPKQVVSVLIYGLLIFVSISAIGWIGNFHRLAYGNQLLSPLGGRIILSIWLAIVIVLVSLIPVILDASRHKNEAPKAVIVEAEKILLQGGYNYYVGMLLDALIANAKRGKNTTELQMWLEKYRELSALWNKTNRLEEELGKLPDKIEKLWEKIREKTAEFDDRYKDMELSGLIAELENCSPKNLKYDHSKHRYRK